MNDNDIYISFGRSVFVNVFMHILPDTSLSLPSLFYTHQIKLANISDRYELQ